MSPVGAVAVMSAAALAGVHLFVTGWRQPRPSLSLATRRLLRQPDHANASRPVGPVERIGSWALAGAVPERVEGWRSSARLVGRPLELHVGILVSAAIVGFIVPSVLFALVALIGDGVGPAPALLSVCCALVLPVLVHSNAMSSADEVRLDLRHQLSAYFDMVTMLLAGNTGHESALDQAAASGDGLLFDELRRRLREADTRGRSHVTALEAVADDFDLEELRQFAATATLTAAEGAPVARTLAAKCSTLRSTMAAEQEARARVRNDKITPPLVGMALLFMALIIYPALQLG